MLDRALRARPRDDALRGLIVKFLADGCADLALYRTIERASEGLLVAESRSVGGSLEDAYLALVGAA